MGARRRAFALVLMLLVSAGLAFGWPWNTDMFWTAVLAPYEETMSSPPTGTLPVEGGELTLAEENPFEPTEANLKRGRDLFEIYCVTCHGEDAKGGGAMGDAFLLPGFDLTALRPESYMYERVRNGGAMMPSYREQLTPEEAWLVVTYVRSLQE